MVHGSSNGTLTGQLRADLPPVNDETFLPVLFSARVNANDAISADRYHSDLGSIATEKYNIYGVLINGAAYLVGTMHGQGLREHDRPRTQEALQGHWFAPYFDNPFQLLKELSESYGEWTDRQQFEAIGDIAEAIIAEGGLTITHMVGDQCYVDVLFPDPCCASDSWILCCRMTDFVTVTVGLGRNYKRPQRPMSGPTGFTAGRYLMCYPPFVQFHVARLLWPIVADCAHSAV